MGVMHMMLLLLLLLLLSRPTLRLLSKLRRQLLLIHAMQERREIRIR
jgi:hypothetical protein